MVLEDSYLSERLEAIASQTGKLGVICPIHQEWFIQLERALMVKCHVVLSFDLMESA